MIVKIQGLNKEEIITVINNVVKNHRNKAFSYYTEEDIEQEAWIIALNKLGDFLPARGRNKDIKQSLENFLNTVVSRRLKNLYRDKYVVPQRVLKSDKSPGDQSKRTNLMHPLNIEEISEDKMKGLDPLNFESDLWHKILKNLNEDLIDILDAMLSGQIIKCYYRNKLLNHIKVIMGENNE